MNQKISYNHAFRGDVIKYMPALIIPALSSLLLLPITTRLFKQSSYGNYAIAISALNFVQLVANAWLGSAIIRFYPGADMQHDTRRFNSTAFVLVLVQSFGTVMIFVVGTLVLFHRLERELLILLLLVPVQLVAVNLLVLPLQTARSQRRIGIYNALTVIRYAFPPAAGVGLSILMGKNVVGMMLGSALIFWVVVPISYRAVFPQKETSYLGAFNKTWAGTLLLFGLPMVPTFLMEEVLKLCDRFIIGAFHGSVAVGIYTASQSIAALSIQLIIFLVTSAAAPLVVMNWERQGREKCEYFLTFLTRVLILVGAPAVVGLSVLSREIVLLISTPDYVRGAVVMPFVAFGAFLLGLQWIAQRGMMLANKTMHIMKGYLIAGSSNILLNLILVPRLGYIAASWAFLASSGILLIIIALGSARILTWRIPWTSVFRSSVGCAVMVLLIQLMKSHAFQATFVSTIFRIIAGALIYGFVLLILGEMDLRVKISELLSRKKDLAARAKANNGQTEK